MDLGPSAYTLMSHMKHKDETSCEHGNTAKQRDHDADIVRDKA